MIWKHAGSSSWKIKFKATTPSRKVVAIMFWDKMGLLYVDFIYKVETINADCYIENLQKLREAVR